MTRNAGLNYFAQNMRNWFFPSILYQDGFLMLNCLHEALLGPERFGLL